MNHLSATTAELKSQLVTLCDEDEDMLNTKCEMQKLQVKDKTKLLQLPFQLFARIKYFILV
jgi:hypothetical protein